MLRATKPVIDFGEVWIGLVSRQSAQWINNDPAPVQVDDYGVVPKPIFDFTTPPARGRTYAPGQTTAPVSIDFIPAHEGNAFGLVYPDLSAPGIAPQLARLEGKGKARVEFGDLSLGPGGYVPPIGPFGSNKPLDFGDIVVGTHSYRTIEVRNSGAAPLAVSVTLESGGAGDFVVSDTSQGPPIDTVSIPAGGSSVVIVTFSPGIPTQYFDALVFSSGGAAGNLAGISLTGRAHDPYG